MRTVAFLSDDATVISLLLEAGVITFSAVTSVEDTSRHMGRPSAPASTKEGMCYRYRATGLR
jgi:hypothetical protein